MNISVVYEDKNILVLNKPAGFITHPKNISDTQDSITNRLIEKHPEIKNVGEPFAASGREVPRAGVVHRLDKDTSGLLLVAKNNETFFYLKKLFQERKIKKTYIALVHGRVKQDKGEIRTSLGKIGTKQTTRIKGKKDLKEREAVTQYKVLKRVGDYTLLEVSPLTGRTHQIRAHFNSIGHPIVGDYVYGKKRDNLARLFLHALKLEFTTPSGKRLFLETDLPEELVNFLGGVEKEAN